LSESTAKNPKAVPAVEWLVSLAVLLVLASVAYSLYLKQQHFNPALTQKRAALEKIQPAAAKPPGAGGPDLAALAKDLLQPLSPPEHFTPGTLYHKINGKADLYLQAGFKSLIAQRLALPGREDVWCELLLYQHESPEQAFAVFSQQRRPGASPLEYHQNGYRSQNALYLAKGPYYLEMVAASPDPALMEAMHQGSPGLCAEPG
jgi:hypothetical protein